MNSPLDKTAQAVDRAVAFLAQHWLAAANLLLLIYVGLPFLAPLLLAHGYPFAANLIYGWYSLACHQLPSRAYYLEGQQVAICHRDVAIYSAMVLGGLGFGLVRRRLKALPGGWYFLLILPMAVDGGMQFVAELEDYLPLAAIWLIALALMGGLGLWLYRRRKWGWPWYLAFAAGLGGLLYLQWIGPYSSNLLNRTVTGAIFGFSTVWLAYPYFEEAGRDLSRFQRQKSAPPPPEPAERR
jgi:uncharacterized membrane protein